MTPALRRAKKRRAKAAALKRRRVVENVMEERFPEPEPWREIMMSNDRIVMGMHGNPSIYGNWSKAPMMVVHPDNWESLRKELERK